MPNTKNNYLLLATILPQKEEKVNMKRSFFGENLRRMRQSKGWTQGQMAEMVGKSQTVISGYERGSCRVDVETAIKIAEVLETTIYAMTAMPPVEMDGSGKEEAV